MVSFEAVRRCGRSMAWIVFGACATVAAQAQTPAHRHGALTLEVAVEAKSILLRLDAPLHDLVGFERAPRSVAERGRITALVEQMKAADKLFLPDPAGRCRLGDVTLDSAVLGLGAAARAAASAPKEAAAPEHAELATTVRFDCDQADAARFVDLKLFDAFKGVKTVDVQVAGPRGQFARSLRRGNARLSLDASAR
jgi:hypothetical protein